MATKRLVNIRDLRSDNDLFTADNLPCCLSAVGYIDDKWSNKANISDESLNDIATKVATAYPNWRHVLFVHSGWLEDNKVTRYKKLWRHLSDTGITLPNGTRSKEIMRTQSHKVLFSGFIYVENIDNYLFSKLLLDNNNFFLMFCEIGEIENIYKTFSESDTVDPRMGLLSENDWLVNVLCSMKASVYRPYAWVDERYSGLILIYNSDNLIYPCTNT